MVDDATVIEVWSPAAKHLLGYRAEEVVGHSMLQILAEPLDLASRYALSRRIPWHASVRLRHFHGHAVDVRLLACPSTGASGHTRWLYVLVAETPATRTAFSALARVLGMGAADICAHPDPQAPAGN